MSTAAAAGNYGHKAAECPGKKIDSDVVESKKVF